MPWIVSHFTLIEIPQSYFFWFDAIGSFLARMIKQFVSGTVHHVNALPSSLAIHIMSCLHNFIQKKTLSFQPLWIKQFAYGTSRGFAKDHRIIQVQECQLEVVQAISKPLTTSPLSSMYSKVTIAGSTMQCSIPLSLL